MLSGLVLTVIITAMYISIKKLNWLVALIRIFHGFGFSIFILAALLIAVILASKEERTYALGIVSTGFMLPLLLAPFIGEEIIKKFGFFFFFLSAVLLAAVPLVYLLFKRIDLPRLSEDPEERSVGFLHLLLKRRVLLIFLLTFIFEIGLSSSLAFVPLLAYGRSALRAGYYYSFLGLTAVFVRVYGGGRLESWGSPKLLLPAFYFLSGGGALLSFASSDFLLGLSGFICGIGVGILYPHLSALIVEGVSSKGRGKVLSLFASSVDLGFAFGPLSFGWIFESLGIRKTFLLFALFVFISSSGLILWGKSFMFNKVKSLD